jgi:hypothetical protein
MKAPTALALAVLAVVFFASPSSFAQVPSKLDRLPIVLEGKVEMTKGGMLNLSWRAVVQRKDPDGAIPGRMTYPGRICGADNAPFDGTFDGKSLKLSIPFEQSHPYSKGWVYQLAWNDFSDHFDGH